MLLTPDEAAGILGLSPFTVRRLLREGELPGRKVGKRQWRIRRTDLDDYLGVSHSWQSRAPEAPAEQRLAVLLDLARKQGVQPVLDFANSVRDDESEKEDDSSGEDVEEFLAPIRQLRERDAARSHL
jgi:excisionase family DNA binding protein